METSRAFFTSSDYTAETHFKFQKGSAQVIEEYRSRSDRDSDDIEKLVTVSSYQTSMLAGNDFEFNGSVWTKTFDMIIELDQETYDSVYMKRIPKER